MTTTTKEHSLILVLLLSYLLLGGSSRDVEEEGEQSRENNYHRYVGCAMRGSNSAMGAENLKKMRGGGEEGVQIWKGGVIYYYHELLLEGKSRDVGEDEEVEQKEIIKHWQWWGRDERVRPKAGIRIDEQMGMEGEEGQRVERWRRIFIYYIMILQLSAAKTSRGQPTMGKRAEVGIMLMMDWMMRKGLLL